jgi:DNA-directed RNA polymerase specialized sigma24 family protein
VHHPDPRPADDPGSADRPVPPSPPSPRGDDRAGTTTAETLPSPEGDDGARHSRPSLAEALATLRPVPRYARLERFLLDQGGLELADVARAAATGGPHEGLAAVRWLLRQLPEWERAHVEAARAEGWSWGEIARVLGRARQPVHRRYARRDGTDP